MTEMQSLVQLVLCLFVVWTLYVVPKLKKQIDGQKIQIDDMKHHQISRLQRQIDDMKHELEEMKKQAEPQS